MRLCAGRDAGEVDDVHEHNCKIFDTTTGSRHILGLPDAELEPQVSATGDKRVLKMTDMHLARESN